MKKVIFGIVVLAIVAAVVLASGMGAGLSAQAAPPAAKPAALPAVKAETNIIAEGKVVPVQSASLAFTTGGIIVQSPIAVGDRVQAGALLAQLDAHALELQLAQADANLASAQARLNGLKHTPTAEDVAAAQQNLASAQAAYDNVLHPNPNEIAALRADVEKTRALLSQAQAAYDRIGGDSNPDAGWMPQRAQLQSAWLDYERAQALYNAKANPTNAQIQQALAAVQNAKNALAKLQPTVDDLAAAQAAVAAAQAARDLVAEQIKNTRLVAPFAGTIVSLDIRQGEYVNPGIAILRFADVSLWQIETTDLTELNVVKVREGMPVVLGFDAIPGMELAGKVSRVKAYGENKQGDIVYTVVVTPEKQDERLRWNMTAQVKILPE